MKAAKAQTGATLERGGGGGGGGGMRAAMKQSTARSRMPRKAGPPRRRPAPMSHRRADRARRTRCGPLPSGRCADGLASMGVQGDITSITPVVAEDGTTTYLSTAECAAMRSWKHRGRRPPGARHRRHHRLVRLRGARCIQTSNAAGVQAFASRGRAARRRPAVGPGVGAQPAGRPSSRTSRRA